MLRFYCGFVRRTREDARRRDESRFRADDIVLPGFASGKSSEVAEAERRAVNTLVQGTAADPMKRAMVRWAAAAAETDEGNVRGGGAMDPGAADVARAANPREVRLVAQIHDELLFECDEDPAAVSRAAERRGDAWGRRPNSRAHPGEGFRGADVGGAATAGEVVGGRGDAKWRVARGGRRGTGRNVGRRLDER